LGTQKWFCQNQFPVELYKTRVSGGWWLPDLGILLTAASASHPVRGEQVLLVCFWFAAY